jgi:dihydrofolate reductase
MKISLIVAASTNNAIGKGGKMPWHLPNDLKHFKNTTWAMPVIMGRKTFESMGKPLAGRKNIVITRQEGYKPEGAVAVQSLSDALFLANEMDVKEIFVIGGGEIYKMAWEKANRIYLTRVKMEAADADTFFPEIDPQEWKLVSQKDFEGDEKNSYPHSFQTWERIFSNSIIIN